MSSTTDQPTTSIRSQVELDSLLRRIEDITVSTAYSYLLEQAGQRRSTVDIAHTLFYASTIYVRSLIVRGAPATEAHAKANEVVPKWAEAMVEDEATRQEVLKKLHAIMGSATPSDD